MRRFSFLLFLAPLAVGCVGEIGKPDDSSFHRLDVTVLPDGVKTVISEGEEKSTFSWDETDLKNFHIFENGVAASSTAATLSGDLVTIKSTFPGTAPAKATISGFMSGSVDGTNPSVLTEQTPVSGSYDPAADILVAETRENLTPAQVAAGLKFPFEREVAISKVTLENLPAGAALTAVSVSADKPLAGTYKYATRTWKTSTSPLTLRCGGTVPSDGRLTVYFTSAPVENAKLSFSVTTDKGTFSKECRSSITLAKGNLTRYTVVVGENSFLEELPDYSRVGYHYSDREIPDVPVKITLTAPQDGADMTSAIQDALDRVETPGAVLLKAGTYNVKGCLKINRSGVVLRGEGESTLIKSTDNPSTEDSRVNSLVEVGRKVSRVTGSYTDIAEKYVPEGRMWVKVKSASGFAVGDRVGVYRIATDEWIHALHMDQIPPRADGGSVSQWKANSYHLMHERTITAIEGNRIFFDNPIVMGIGNPDPYSELNFGSGRLYHISVDRISECGVENLSLDTRYNSSVKEGKDFVDEKHCWSAITVYAVEHGWVRNTVSRHFGFASVALMDGSKNITVSGCSSYSPVALVTGSRRYAFYMGDCQHSLFKDCTCDDDRHQFVSGSRVNGPNVFLRCKGTNGRNAAGPHHRWTTGLLYDNVDISGNLYVQDSGNYGSGHGWCGANVVLYNCTAGQLVVQSPWVSATNWSIGCKGNKLKASRTYEDSLGDRPDGRWISYGKPVSPQSLYEYQLQKRHAAGIYIDK